MVTALVLGRCGSLTAAEVFDVLDAAEEHLLDHLRVVTAGDDGDVGWYCRQWVRARDRELHLISEDIRLAAPDFMEWVVATYDPSAVLLFGTSPGVRRAEDFIDRLGIPVIRVPTYA